MTTHEAAEAWGISERSVRNYCQRGRVSGAIHKSGRWLVPALAAKPARSNARRKNSSNLLCRLRQEKSHRIAGGIYHRVQIDMAYNSNHMEGSTLTHDQTRFIFETKTLGLDQGQLNVDDILEASNHFACLDLVIDNANRRLTEAFIKRLHAMLKQGTSDSRLDWFNVGEYKSLPNEVGGRMTTAPEDVPSDMALLIAEYEQLPERTLDDLLDFHCRFERIHPFQDGNGRIGRLILFKECLRNGIVPFILGDDMKAFYYRGLAEWERERGFLRDTCLFAQDAFRAMMDAFRVE